MPIRSSPPTNPVGKTVLPWLLVVVLALACGPDSMPNATEPMAPSLNAMGKAQLSRDAGGGQEGKIVFHSNRGRGDLDVYVMNADGTDQTAITSDDNEDIDPTWSPNGKLIAFNRFPADFSGCEVYVMNADGSGVRQLTHGGTPYDFGGIWSPDGKQIAFKSNRDGDDDLYVMNADGTGIKQITNIGWAAAVTAWSPNGKQLAFIGYYDYTQLGDAGDTEIYVVNVGDGKISQLTDNQVDDEGDHAGWSPNGKLFSFSRRSEHGFGAGHLDVFVMNADGTGIRQITGIGGDGAVDDDDSTWSPDGKYLAFQSTRDGDEEVYTIPIDLSRPARQLTFNELFSDAVPVWAAGKVHSPDKNDDHHDQR